MEVMEEGNLMDRIPILLARDMEYYEVKLGHCAKRTSCIILKLYSRQIKMSCKKPFVRGLLAVVSTFLATHRLHLSRLCCGLKTNTSQLTADTPVYSIFRKSTMTAMTETTTQI